MRKRRRRLNTKTDKWQKWLTSVQQDSWHLELIFNGIALFMIIGGIQYLDGMFLKLLPEIETSDSDSFSISHFGLPVSSIALQVLLIVFILSLSLRGLWIVAVSLRPFNGEYQWDALPYQAPISTWLRKRLGNYDDYVQKLGLQAQMAFATAILLFFVVLSLAFFIIFFSGALFFFEAILAWLFGEIVVGLALLIIIFIILLWGILYLLDFLTHGYLKRLRIIRRFYYPIYRMMGWVTLARMYRPLYYAIIHIPGQKKIFGWYLLGFVFITLTVDKTRISAYEYWPKNDVTEQRIFSHHYVDETDYTEISINNSDLFTYPSLSSKYPSGNYLEVFLPYKTNVSGFDLKVYNAFDSIVEAQSFFYNPEGLFDNEDADPAAMLAAHASLYQLSLNDSLLTDVNWKFYEHPKRRQKGLIYHLPVHHLPIGEHYLGIDIKVVAYRDNAALDRDSVYWHREADILFFK